MEYILWLGVFLVGCLIGWNLARVRRQGRRGTCYSSMRMANYRPTIKPGVLNPPNGEASVNPFTPGED